MADEAGVGAPIQVQDRFGKLAVKSGLITQEQLDEAISVQQAAAKAGLRKRLGDILVKKGYLTDEQVQQILKGQVAKTKESRIGDYEVMSKLGEGAMGAVYKARQTLMDRVVALKILAPKLAKDPDYRERFIREARAVAKLNHPHIGAGIDVGSDKGYYFFAMEFIEGESIGRRMVRKGGRLSEKESLEYARQVALALHHAHSHGILHRDVKPENILLDKDGQAKLADLGLARSAHKDERKLKGHEGADDASLTMSGMAVGTPYYISPEQARGEKDLSAGTDLYSLGATLFHMLTGKHVYEGSTGQSIMAKHITEPVRDPREENPRLTKATSRIVTKLLQKDPKDRYRDGERLATDLEEAREQAAAQESDSKDASRGRIAVGAYAAPVAGGATTNVRAARITRRRQESAGAGMVIAGLVGVVILGIVAMSMGGGGRARPRRSNPAPEAIAPLPPAPVKPVAQKQPRKAEPAKAPEEAPELQPADVRPEPAVQPEPTPEEKPQADEKAFLFALFDVLRSARLAPAEKAIAEFRAGNGDEVSAKAAELAVACLKDLDARWQAECKNFEGCEIAVKGQVGKIAKADDNGFALALGQLEIPSKWHDVPAATRLDLLKVGCQAPADLVARGFYLFFRGDERDGSRLLFEANQQGHVQLSHVWNTQVRSVCAHAFRDEIKELDKLVAASEWEKLKAAVERIRAEAPGFVFKKHQPLLDTYMAKADRGLTPDFVPVKPDPKEPPEPGAEAKPDPVVKLAKPKNTVPPSVANARIESLNPNTPLHVRLVYDFRKAEQLKDFVTDGDGAWEIKDGALYFSPGNGRSYGHLTHKACWAGQTNLEIVAQMTFLELRAEAGLGLRDTLNGGPDRQVALLLGGNQRGNTNWGRGGNGNRGAQMFMSEIQQIQWRDNWGYDVNKTYQPSLSRLGERWSAKETNWEFDNRKRKELPDEWPGHAMLFSKGTRIRISALALTGVMEPNWYKNQVGDE